MQFPSVRSVLKLITFDATGTFMKFRKPPPDVYMDHAAKYGLQVEKDELKVSFKRQWMLMNKEQPNFGKCWRTWWTDFVKGTFKGCIPRKDKIDEDILLKLSSELIEYFGSKDSIIIKEGTNDLLKYLRDSGKVKLGVISNYDPRLHTLLEEHELTRYFNIVVTSHEVECSKPNMGIYRYAQKKVGLEGLQPRNCIHFGNSYEMDCAGALHAGWNSALLSELEHDYKGVVHVTSISTLLGTFQSRNESLKRYANKHISLNYSNT